MTIDTMDSNLSPAQREIEQMIRLRREVLDSYERDRSQLLAQLRRINGKIREIEAVIGDMEAASRAISQSGPMAVFA